VLSVMDVYPLKSHSSIVKRIEHVMKA